MHPGLGSWVNASLCLISDVVEQGGSSEALISWCEVLK